MDWLTPQEGLRNDLNLGGHYDSLYKPYTVEPLVSRYSYNGSSGSYNGSSGLAGTSNSIGRRPGVNRVARTVALDDIDELTLAVETKNFLGNKAVVLPTSYNTAGTSIYAANPASQMNGGGYESNQALFTSIYDEPGNSLYGPSYDEQIYNPNQFQ
jgi:hypothetical protein